jgi:hypothetical protein
MRGAGEQGRLTLATTVAGISTVEGGATKRPPDILEAFFTTYRLLDMAPKSVFGTLNAGAQAPPLSGDHLQLRKYPPGLRGTGPATENGPYQALILCRLARHIKVVRAEYLYMAFLKI